MLNKNQICVIVIMSLGLSASALARGGMGSAQYDINQDGQVTSEEIETVRAATFNEADSNGDGNLNLEELQVQMENQRTKRQAERYTALDTDGNGQLSVTEFQESHPSGDVTMSTTLFGLADENGDSALSQAEFAALKSPEGRVWHHFARLDTDGNGVISPTEFVEAKLRRGGHHGRRGY